MSTSEQLEALSIDDSSSSRGERTPSPSSPLPRHARGFHLKRSLPGCDVTNAPWCTPHQSICDLCYRFIESFLTLQFDTPDSADSYTPDRVAYARQSRNATRPFFYHYSSRRMLQSSADAGCNLCLKLLEYSKPTECDRMVIALKPQQTNQTKSEKKFLPTFSFCALRQLEIRTFDPWLLPFEFLLAKDEADSLSTPHGYYNTGLKYPALHASSKESLETISQWRTECKKAHHRCSGQSSSLPLRLLDLMAVDTADPRVVLVDTDTIPKTSEKVQYVALSYCWGSEGKVVTTRENILARKSGMNLSDLPATLRDAVRVCRSCDIQYLWVDALCICQNDEDEWSREAANMANVYGGCEFALSALSSSAADDGFLQDRCGLPVSLGQVNLSYGTWSETVQLFVRRKPLTLRNEIENSPLNQRAWPLQEKILAPAVLHFGRDQIAWECDTKHLRSETGEMQDLADVVIRLSNKGGLHGRRAFWKTWDAIIVAFTKRKLTHAKDRLVALAGMASRLRTDGVYCGRYVAGLWEEELAHQLLWRVSVNDSGLDLIDYEPPEQLPDIPTWSWAHKNLPVLNQLEADPTSALERKATFCFKNDRLDQESIDGTSVESCAVLLHGTIQRVSDETLYRDSHAVRTSCARYCRYRQLPGVESSWFFDEEPLPPGEYYCLRVAHSPSHQSEDIPKGHRHGSCIYYLLIREAKTDAAKEYAKFGTVYHRVGILFLGQTGDKDFVKPYPDVYCKDGQPLLTDGKLQEVVLI